MVHMLAIGVEMINKHIKQTSNYNAYKLHKTQPQRAGLENIKAATPAQKNNNNMFMNNTPYI